MSTQDNPDCLAPAIDCVASIPIHWNADGSPKHYLLDRDDAETVVAALHEAGFLK